MEENYRTYIYVPVAKVNNHDKNQSFSLNLC